MDMSETIARYVLITPARNEEKFIKKTIQSMIRQTVLPLRWVIVNDGSTDATATIVRRFLEEHPWIELADLPPRKDRNFAGKVYAFNEGLARVRDLEYDIVGNLDADISFDPDHFDFLLRQFAENPRLGVGGTAYTQENNWDSTHDSFEGENSVHGACQTVSPRVLSGDRRLCRKSRRRNRLDCGYHGSHERLANPEFPRETVPPLSDDGHGAAK